MRSTAVVLPVLLLLSSAAPAWCGDVAASGGGSKLELTSGAGDESLTITGIDATSFQVTPNPPTTLNGSADPQVFSSRTVTVALGLGTNTLAVTGATLGSLDVQGDAGNDSVTVTQCDCDRARFRLGGGDNALVLTDSAVGNPLVYKGGAGSDAVSVLRTPVDGKLGFQVGDGPNTVEVDSVQALHLSVQGGGGSDTVDAVDVTLGKGVRLALAGGANDTKLTRLTAASSFLYAGGADTDWLDLTTVTFTKGKALVKGKGGDNSVIANALIIGKQLAVMGGFGDDDLVLIDSTIPEGIQMKVSGGENELALQNTIVGEKGLTYRGGKGADVANIGGGAVAGSVVVDLGGADNTFATAGGAVIGPLTVKSRNGVDGVELLDTHVTGDVKVALSSGANVVTLDAATIDGGFTLKTGPQADAYSKLNGTTIAGTEKVKLGGGANTVTP